jgi:hypothetical protein
MPTVTYRRREDEFYGNEIAVSLHEWFPPKRPQWKPKPRPHLRDRWVMPMEDAAVCALAVEPLIVNEAVATEAHSLEQKFLELADQWDRETSFLSSTPKKVLNESYQTIMAMGPDIVPYLLRDLQRTRRAWFWALRHLTRANPVPQEDQGNLDKMIAAWVAWGKNERLL